jgi:CheY-like chemotaxis protein
MTKRILLAEDNQDTAEIVSFVLKFLGHEVVLATDGVEAVEKAISFQPDLILMDMMMPRMDGFEAVSELRQHADTKTIPIVAATALASAGDRKKCLAAGCDDYLSKPVTAKQLAPAIERLLRSDHARPADHRGSGFTLG